jgi:hypothetical protein
MNQLPKFETDDSGILVRAAELLDECPPFTHWKGRTVRGRFFEWWTFDKRKKWPVHRSALMYGTGSRTQKQLRLEPYLIVCTLPELLAIWQETAVDDGSGIVDFVKLKLLSLVDYPVHFTLKPRSCYGLIALQ